jgi:hypothetical protein
MAEAGTFIGHVIPGTVFILYGFWWFRTARRASGIFSYPWEAFVILVLLVGDAIGEVWWASWLLTDSSVMNYQHATMYLCFAVPAVCYLLARRGLVSAQLPSLTLGGAFAATGGMFLAHGSHAGVSGTVHFLLAVILFACAFVSAAEGIWPSAALAVARCWLTIAAGTWLWHTAVVLYKSSYEYSAGFVMRMDLFLIWHLLAVGGVLLAIHLAMHSRHKGALA